MATSKHIRKRTKNYGFIPSYPQPDDYVLGGYSPLPKDVLQANGQWDEFLPVDEFQSKVIETMACTSYGTTSAIETLVNRLFGTEHNWSDRWLAKISGTTRTGNNVSIVCETLRKLGVPFQERWDYTPDIDSWDKFYEVPPPKLYDHAKQDFKDIYEMKHEFVFPDEKSLKEALQYSPLGVSVYAWVQRDGLHYKPEGLIDNHWCVLYGYEDGKYWKVFDSYDNTRKKLAWDFKPLVIKRFCIEKKTEELTFWQKVGRIPKNIRCWVCKLLCKGCTNTKT